MLNIPENVEKTWDENTKQNYVEWEKSGTKYQMWIEDAKSIEEKLNLINKYELAGGAFWEKDRETDDIWELAEEKLK